MPALSMTTSLREIDLSDGGVRRAIAEMLPSAARSKCPNGGVVPAELLEEVVHESSVRNVADLVLELAVILTDGHFAGEVEIDTSAVELVPEPDTEGVLRILVRAGLDLRGWLAERETLAMLHEWYVQYQVAGTLHSERQLTELHEELSWVEEHGGQRSRREKISAASASTPAR